MHAGPFPTALGASLAIGATEPVTIVLDDQRPVGPWTARITLRSGLLEHSKEMIIAAGPGALPAAAVSLTLMRRRQRPTAPAEPGGQTRLA